MLHLKSKPGKKFLEAVLVSGVRSCKDVFRTIECTITKAIECGFS
jgi:hypothetical protein